MERLIPVSYTLYKPYRPTPSTDILFNPIYTFITNLSTINIYITILFHYSSYIL